MILNNKDQKLFDDWAETIVSAIRMNNDHAAIGIVQSIFADGYCVGENCGSFAYAISQLVQSNLRNENV